MANETSAGWYETHFAMFEKTLDGGPHNASHALRRSAFARFGEMGFPTTRDEEWRFTNVAAIAGANYKPQMSPSLDDVTAADVNRWAFPGTESYLLVFLNGHFVRQFSSIPALPARARIAPLSEALAKGNGPVLEHLGQIAPYASSAFTALNTSFIQDGAFIHVPDGVELGMPVHLLFLATGRLASFTAQPRTLVIAGKGARVSVVETYAHVTHNAYFTNAVTEIFAGEGAVIEHDKLQAESSEAYHVGTLAVHQEQGSTVTSNSVALGGAIARNTVTAILAGSHAHCTLNGLSVSAGTQLIDNHTVIDHAAPDCESHELYKAILDGSSRGVFNGKIFVRKDAQKTNAKQTNKTLLLSDDATIDTKPQLEILADDVKCTHGATVGQLDEEQIFYLRSRGIGEAEAKDLLTFAFASNVIGQVHCDPLRAKLEAMMHDRLQRGRVVEEA